MSKTILILSSLICSNFAFADKEKTLPFIISESPAVLYYSGKPPREVSMGAREAIASTKNNPNNNSKSKDSVKNIAVTKITELLNDAREAICGVNPHGEFKVWLKLDASEKVLGFGTSGEAGVEVLVKCNVG